MNASQKWPIASALVAGKIENCIWGRKGAQRTQTRAPESRPWRRPRFAAERFATRIRDDSGSIFLRIFASSADFAAFARNAFLFGSGRRLVQLCALALLASSVQAAPVDYRFDPVHSKLLFFADHMGFSTAIGRFARWQGEFRYDPDDASANHVDVSIDIGSLDLGDANWNKTMLSRKWFDVEQHPQARFVGTRFELIDATHARLSGELTLLGNTHPQVLDVQINRIGTHPYTLKATAGFSATTTISRSLYGLDALHGTLADAVELRIEVEGQRAEPVARKPGKR